MNIGRKIMVISCLLVYPFCGSRLWAQQDPIYTNYMYNMLTVNPAYAGTRETRNMSALFRKQWVGIQGAPQTTVLSFDMPANNDWLGLGLQLFNDQIGIQKTSGLVSSYAFRMHVFNQEDELSIGLQAGISNYKADYTQVDLIQPYDPSFDGNVVNVWLPSIGSGIYYHNDYFYAGISAPNLIRSSLKSKSVVIQSAVQSKLASHYFFTAGCVLEVSDVIKLRPSFLLKSVGGAPLQADLNTNVWINDVFSFGVSYRTGDAMVGLLGLQINPQLGLGYSYDKSLSGIGQLSAGTHEVFMRYEIPAPERNNYVKPKIYQYY